MESGGVGESGRIKKSSALSATRYALLVPAARYALSAAPFPLRVVSQLFQKTVEHLAYVHYEGEKRSEVLLGHELKIAGQLDVALEFIQ